VLILVFGAFVPQKLDFTFSVSLNLLVHATKKRIPKLWGSFFQFQGIILSGAGLSDL
jgi:hypothetical protein